MLLMLKFDIKNIGTSIVVDIATLSRTVKPTFLSPE